MRYKDEIARLRNEGKSYREIKGLLGCSASTVFYHLSDRYKARTKRRVVRGLNLSRKFKKKLGILCFGGGCVCCGYSLCSGALDFHHIELGSKGFDLSSSLSHLSLAEYKAELQKCVLVCCRCHREIHAGVTSLPLNPRRLDSTLWDTYVMEGRQI